MKHYLKIMAIALVAIIASGCSSIKKLDMKLLGNDGVSRDAYLSMKTVSNTPDRSVSRVQVGVDMNNGIGRLDLLEVAGDTTIGTRFLSQAAMTLLSNVPATLIQMKGQKDIAKIYSKGRECPPGTEVCHSTIMQALGGTGGDSFSNAESTSNSEVDIDSNSGRPPMAELPPMRD